MMALALSLKVSSCGNTKLNKRFNTGWKKKKLKVAECFIRTN